MSDPLYLELRLSLQEAPGWTMEVESSTCLSSKVHLFLELAGSPSSPREGKTHPAQAFGSFEKTWAPNPSDSSVHTTQHLAHRMGQDYCVNEDQSMADIPVRSGQILGLLVNCWRTHFSA